MEGVLILHKTHTLFQPALRGKIQIDYDCEKTEALELKAQEERLIIKNSA